MKGDLVVVEALLRHGADRQQRSNGMTPADVAREYGQAHLLSGGMVAFAFVALVGVYAVNRRGAR